jgi:hypothetical protein
MIAYNFHAAGNEARGSADAGHWELVQRRQEVMRTSRHVFRAAHASHAEQVVIDRLCVALGDTCPRSLAVSLYVALKASPLVVISGPPGSGKARLIERFATALLGAGSEQFVTIGSGSWAHQSGERNYYRNVHERFGSLHLLEMLQEAAAPENAGKAFLLFLKGPTPEDLAHYFGDLLHVAPGGALRLALPGLPDTGRPSLPQNVFVTATIHVPQVPSPRGQLIVQHAAQINLGAVHIAPTPPPALPPVPVGLQRALLATSIHDATVARERLQAIFGRRRLRTLKTMPQLTRAFWSGSTPGRATTMPELLLFVANSFDAAGNGLFDPHDQLQNLQRAGEAWMMHQFIS